MLKLLALFLFISFAYVWVGQLVVLEAQAQAYAYGRMVQEQPNNPDLEDKFLFYYNLHSYLNKVF